MPNKNFADRFTKIFNDNKLSQTEASQLTGIGQSVISNLVNRKIDKKYSDFDSLLKICKNEDQRYYLATGEHLPERTAETDINREMLDTVKNLTVLVGSLIKEMYDLKEEIKGLKCIKEVSESAQVRLPQKIPEHH